MFEVGFFLNGLLGFQHYLKGTEVQLSVYRCYCHWQNPDFPKFLPGCQPALTVAMR